MDSYNEEVILTYRSGQKYIYNYEYTKQTLVLYYLFTYFCIIYYY